jgi:predicted esterase
MVASGAVLALWAGSAEPTGAAVATSTGARALTGAAGMIGVAEVAAPPSRVDSEAVGVLAEEFESLSEDVPDQVFAAATKLSRVKGDTGYFALRSAWERIESAQVRGQLLRALVNARESANDTFDGPRLKPRTIDALHLGVRDPSALVQAGALQALRPIAFEDFAEDFPRYAAWYEKAKGRDANVVLRESISAWVARAMNAQGDDVRRMVDFVDENGSMLKQIPLARQAAIDAGWTKLLERWLLADTTSMQQAMRMVTGFPLARRELEETILPMTGKDKHPALRAWAVTVLGDARSAWALESLLKTLEETRDDQRAMGALLSPLCRALGTIGDARAIPSLIAAMEVDGTSAGMMTIGTFGLSPMTGVKQTGERDAAWWRGWWLKNRDRFGPVAAKLEVPDWKTPPPTAAAGAQTPTTPAGAEGDLPDVPTITLRASYDNDKKFFLMGLKRGAIEPAEGYRLLIVLPGGDGGMSFKPFVQRVYRDALPPGWLVAQLVAPMWDDEQKNKIVWPTGPNPYAGAKFTSEEFLESVVAEVKSRAAIDDRHVHVLAWSSGGPAAYAAALRVGSPVRGAVVAMSVFDGAKAGAIDQAKGKRFFLYQSPEDTLTPLAQAEGAERTLSEAGGRVMLRRYAGGHGWTGDWTAAVKDAIAFLTQPEPIPGTDKPAR